MTCPRGPRLWIWAPWVMQYEHLISQSGIVLGTPDPAWLDVSLLQHLIQMIICSSSLITSFSFESVTDGWWLIGNLCSYVLVIFIAYDFQKNSHTDVVITVSTCCMMCCTLNLCCLELTFVALLYAWPRVAFLRVRMTSLGSHWFSMMMTNLKPWWPDWDTTKMWPSLL